MWRPRAITCAVVLGTAPLASIACARTRPPLVVAAMHGDLPAVQVLLQAGADPNRCSEPEGATAFSALTAAVARDDLRMVDTLIRAGATVDRPCGLERPMDIAVSGGRVAVAERLIQAGADVTARTQGGWTYLMEAAVSVQPAVIPLLIKNGCPLEARRPDSGETVLIMASSWDLRVTTPLLAAGANVNARSNNGDTPLLAALKGARFASDNPQTTPGHFTSEIVEQLLRAGADPTVHNTAGETAYHLAAETGRFKPQIERMLRAAARVP